jgi:hypothetical protein
MFVCIPRNFLVIKVCNRGKTLCSPCISSAVDETDHDMLWTDNEEDGNVRSATKMKALTVKMDSNTDW